MKYLDLFYLTIIGVLLIIITHLYMRNIQFKLVVNQIAQSNSDHFSIAKASREVFK